MRAYKVARYAALLSLLSVHVATSFSSPIQEQQTAPLDSSDGSKIVLERERRQTNDPVRLHFDPKVEDREDQTGIKITQNNQDIGLALLKRSTEDHKRIIRESGSHGDEDDDFIYDDEDTTLPAITKPQKPNSLAGKYDSDISRRIGNWNVSSDNESGKATFGFHGIEIQNGSGKDTVGTHEIGIPNESGTNEMNGVGRSSIGNGMERRDRGGVGGIGVVGEGRGSGGDDVRARERGENGLGENRPGGIGGGSGGIGGENLGIGGGANRDGPGRSGGGSGNFEIGEKPGFEGHEIGSGGIGGGSRTAERQDTGNYGGVGRPGFGGIGVGSGVGGGSGTAGRQDTGNYGGVGRPGFGGMGFGSGGIGGDSRTAGNYGGNGQPGFGGIGFGSGGIGGNSRTVGRYDTGNNRGSGIPGFGGTGFGSGVGGGSGTAGRQATGNYGGDGDRIIFGIDGRGPGRRWPSGNVQRWYGNGENIHRASVRWEENSIIRGNNGNTHGINGKEGITEGMYGRNDGGFSRRGGYAGRDGARVNGFNIDRRIVHGHYAHHHGSGGLGTNPSHPGGYIRFEGRSGEARNDFNPIGIRGSYHGSDGRNVNSYHLTHRQNHYVHSHGSDGTHFYSPGMDRHDRIRRSIWSGGWGGAIGGTVSNYDVSRHFEVPHPPNGYWPTVSSSRSGMFPHININDHQTFPNPIGNGQYPGTMELTHTITHRTDDREGGKTYSYSFRSNDPSNHAFGGGMNTFGGGGGGSYSGGDEKFNYNLGYGWDWNTSHN